jgi:hypothetical protein
MMSSRQSSVNYRLTKVKEKPGYTVLNRLMKTAISLHDVNFLLSGVLQVASESQET